MSRRPWHYRCRLCGTVIGTLTDRGDLMLDGERVEVRHADDAEGDGTTLALTCQNTRCWHEWRYLVLPGQAVTWRLSPMRVA